MQIWSFQYEEIHKNMKGKKEFGIKKNKTKNRFLQYLACGA
jgi:hypothetical protein